MSILSQQSVKAQFEALIPTITAHLKKMFRAGRCACTKADFVAEALALCWRWFVRAAALGKDAAAIVGPMTTFAARKVRSGGTVCGMQPAKDVMSLTAKLKHGVVVKSLSASGNHTAWRAPAGGQIRLAAFEEALSENTVTPVPDQVIFRIDWPEFLNKLTKRDRKMVEFLALGNSNNAAADAFGISRGRVSQLRRGWCEKWKASAV
jgi:hypothetical protein